MLFNPIKYIWFFHTHTKFTYQIVCTKHKYTEWMRDVYCIEVCCFCLNLFIFIDELILIEFTRDVKFVCLDFPSAFCYSSFFFFFTIDVIFFYFRYIIFLFLSLSFSGISFVISFTFHEQKWSRMCDRVSEYISYFLFRTFRCRCVKENAFNWEEN